MPYVVNTKGYSCTLNGIHFPPGVSRVRDEHIERARQDPLGRGSYLGNELGVFASLTDLAGAFSQDDLLQIVEQTLRYVRAEKGLNALIDVLRELYRGIPNEEVKRFLISFKQKLETGDRPSFFEKSVERFEITL